jgi:hypothetical protein
MDAPASLFVVSLILDFMRKRELGKGESGRVDNAGGVGDNPIT